MARRNRPFWFISGGIGVLVVGSGIFTYISLLNNPVRHCVFPDSIRKNSSSLALYCPNPAKLPSGVTSDTARATSGNSAVVYTLYDGEDKLAVSLQKKPANDQLENFVPNLIPLHFDVDTPVGKAQTGVSHGQTLTSLPTASATWILITAPGSYNPDRLSTILKSFQAD